MTMKRDTVKDTKISSPRGIFKHILCMYVYIYMKVRVSHSVMSNSMTPCTVACQAPLPMESSRQKYWSEKKKNTGVNSHSFLLGIFLTQGWNLSLLHCRQILYRLSFLSLSLSIYICVCVCVCVCILKIR